MSNINVDNVVFFYVIFSTISGLLDVQIQLPNYFYFYFFYLSIRIIVFFKTDSILLVNNSMLFCSYSKGITLKKISSFKTPTGIEYVLKKSEELERCDKKLTFHDDVSLVDTHKNGDE